MDPVFSKKRGLFLTVIIFYFSLYLIRALFPEKNVLIILENPIINPVFVYYIILLLDFIAIWGIWAWHKKAIYLKIATEISMTSALAVPVVLEHPNDLEFVGSIIGVVISVSAVIGLFIWAVKRKWEYFH